MIGPGGKIIQDIQARTGTIINIEEVDEKELFPSWLNGDGLKQALGKKLTKLPLPQVGDTYDAFVESVMEYGVFRNLKANQVLYTFQKFSHQNWQGGWCALKLVM